MNNQNRNFQTEYNAKPKSNPFNNEKIPETLSKPSINLMESGYVNSSKIEVNDEKLTENIKNVLVTHKKTNFKPSFNQLFENPRFQNQYEPPPEEEEQEIIVDSDEKPQIEYKTEQSKTQQVYSYQDVQVNKSFQIELDREKRRSKDLENHVQKLNQELSNSQMSQKKMENQLKNLQSDYEQLRRDHLNNMESVNQVQGEKDKIAAANKTIDSELKKNREKIQSQRDEIDRLRNDLTKSINEQERVQQFLIVLKQENEKLKNDKQSKNNIEITPVDIDSQERIQVLMQKLKVAEEQRESALSNQTKMAIQIQNQKLEIDKLKIQNETTLKTITTEENENENNLKYENEQLKRKIQGIEHKLQDQQDDFNHELESINRKLVLSQQKVEDLESSIQQQGGKDIIVESKLEQIKKKYETQLKVLLKQTEYKDKKLKELEEDLQQFSTELNQLKQENLQLHLKVEQNQDSDDNKEINITDIGRYKKKYKKCKEKLESIESEYTDKINSMQLYIEKLEQSINSQEKGTKTQEFDMKMAKLSVDNEKLRNKLKEYELTKNSKNLDAENKKLTDELISLKLQIANFESKCTSQQKDLQYALNNYKTLDEKFKQQQEDLVKSKIQVGEMMNLVMNTGNVTLIDEFTNYMQSGKG